MRQLRHVVRFFAFCFVYTPRQIPCTLIARNLDGASAAQVGKVNSIREMVHNVFPACQYLYLALLPPLPHPPAAVEQFDKKPLHSTAHDQVAEYKSSPSLHPTPHPLHYSQIIASLSPNHSPYPIRRRGLSIHHLMITPARPALKSSPHQPPYHNHQTSIYQ